MDTKLQIRALDAQRKLLGWVEVYAHARGDGQLWTMAPVIIPIEVEGTVVSVSVHWVDINVETALSLDNHLMSVKVGDNLTVMSAGYPIIRVGPQAQDLPPVAVRTPVVVGVPVGSFSGESR